MARKPVKRKSRARPGARKYERKADKEKRLARAAAYANRKPPVYRDIPYSLELVQDICERVANGEPVKHICMDASRYPHRNIFNKWLHEHEDALELYLDAKSAWAEKLVHENFKIADECPTDCKEEVMKAKLRINVRQWAAEKTRDWMPKRKVELSGPNDKPVELEIHDASAKLQTLLAGKAGRQAKPGKKA